MEGAQRMEYSPPHIRAMALFPGFCILYHSIVMPILLFSSPGNPVMKRILLLSLFAAMTGGVSAQESRIELQSHYSPLLGTQKNYNIFLPEGYDRDSLRYPVVYLFRGHEREWANPTEDGSRRGNIKTVADRLYAAGTIGRMILVMPGISQPGTSADFAYAAEELIPYIDAHFRTIPVRQKRGMDGFSLGGYDVLQLLRRSPELFFTAGAYDGSFWLVNLNTFFAGTGEPYWNLLRQMKFLVHSTPSGNYTSNQQFLSILQSHGITNAFDTLAIAPSSSHNWYFADLHMEKSLPLHWQHFLVGSETLAVQIVSPLPASTVSGAVPVSWSVQPPAENVRTVVEYSRNRGKSWLELYSSATTDTSFLWNTLPLQDGTGYRLRVRVLGDTTYGFTQMAGSFTLNNPGNAVPEVEILFPDSAQTLTGVQAVRWRAEDADSDLLTISIETSTDDGTTWTHLADPLHDGMYLWNTAAAPNTSRYRLKIRGSDGTSSGVAISPPFSVFNHRPSLQSTLVEHVKGIADGSIGVHVVDSAAVSGRRYRILFHDSIPGSKTYSVIDLDQDVMAVPGAPVGLPGQEGPLFDGLRLVLADYDPPRISKDSTRWITGGSDLIPVISLPSFYPDTGLVTGVPYVSDYTIQLFDQTVDTSGSFYGWTPAPMNFTVWNMTESHRVEVLFTDLNGDRMIGQYDDLILIERDALGKPFPTWELFFTGPSNPVLPSAGDLFLFKILKPFTRRDIYEFTAHPGGIVTVGPLPSPVTIRLEQNYPNPFNPMSSIGYEVGHTGDPLGGTVDVRIAVYDLLGRSVVVLVNERKRPGRYEVVFDGSGLASGVYLYRLQTGSFVQTRKMLLLR